jgi:molybdenum cofactor guanylyltransferase
MAPADFDTVILAGGRATRMDGTDKPALEVGGQPMLVSVARAAAAAGTRRLIVVGPERDGPVRSALAEVAASLPGGVVTACESPPGGGPVPALRCGLPVAGAPWLALLAADLPFLTGPWLTAVVAMAESAGQAGAVLADDSGRPQWLVGCWNAQRLRSGLREYRGQSLAGLLGPLQPALLRPGVPAAAGPADAGLAGTATASTGSASSGVTSTEPGERPPWLDCDDPAQLAAARAAWQDGET